VLDKVDLRVPEGAPFGQAISEAARELRMGPAPPFRASRFYQYVADLREFFRIDAVLHLNYRYGVHAHKIEIIDAGKKSVDEIADICCQLFEVDPWRLEVMRIDLAADVEGAPVRWFRDHARVERKQFSSRIEKSMDQEVEFVGMGTAQAQTLYAGKRPNLIRIYDKIAEWNRQVRKLATACRRFNAGMTDLEMTPEQKYFGARVPPSLEEFCRAEGYEYKEGSILTRIEQQIGGGRLPKELSTLNDLRCAHEFTPFESLQIVGGDCIQHLESLPDSVPMRNRLAALGLQTLEEEFGSVQLAHSFVLRHAKGNGRRILDSIAKCRPTERAPLTLSEIQESYRVSTRLQTCSIGKGVY
jgi:hypothetical protein